MPTQFFPSKIQLALFGSISFGLALAGAWAATLSTLTFIARLSGVGAAAFFGWLAYRTFTVLSDPRPAIELDDWGIRDRRGNIAAPWGSIMAVRAWWHSTGNYDSLWTMLEVRDADAMFTNSNFAKTTVRAPNGNALILLRTGLLKEGRRGVLAAIRKYRPALPIDEAFGLNAGSILRRELDWQATFYIGFSIGSALLVRLVAGVDESSQDDSLARAVGLQLGALLPCLTMFLPILFIGKKLNQLRPVDGFLQWFGTTCGWLALYVILLFLVVALVRACWPALERDALTTNIATSLFISCLTASILGLGLSKRRPNVRFEHNA